MSETLRADRLATSYATPFGPITRTDLVRYAGAGGDLQPMHHDDGHARSIGYRSVFAHGLLTAGLASSAVAERFGTLAVRSFTVRYVGQVWPDDTLTFELQPTADDTDPGVLHVAVTVRAQGGDVDSLDVARTVMTGAAVVRA